MASSSVMNKLPTKKMPNPIQEVRFGLYSILQNNNLLVLISIPCANTALSLSKCQEPLQKESQQSLKEQ
ncbi:hypothetical protein DAPPUDRAFT_274061 [Daphnia pulex]|uniref:Uncharacterized protein n=1 Tax=Daphnia pulex TaxID=6669 RepID=E9I3V2_DAPPU|nr:hypothetical protein DAPPUDRAFT_274061 [Daphnia pulex]|eukprot:EFX61328.1 hypothetical protein DAPPUDRAFT_274061 [Daphnia pulex]